MELIKIVNQYVIKNDSFVIIEDHQGKLYQQKWSEYKHIYLKEITEPEDIERIKQAIADISTKDKTDGLYLQAYKAYLHEYNLDDDSHQTTDQEAKEFLDAIDDIYKPIIIQNEDHEGSLRHGIDTKH